MGFGLSLEGVPKTASRRPSWLRASCCVGSARNGRVHSGRGKVGGAAPISDRARTNRASAAGFRDRKDAPDRSAVPIGTLGQDHEVRMVMFALLSGVGQRHLLDADLG